MEYGNGHSFGNHFIAVVDAVEGEVGEGEWYYVVRIRIRTRRSKRGLLLGKESKEGEKERLLLFRFFPLFFCGGGGGGGLIFFLVLPQPHLLIVASVIIIGTTIIN